MEGMNSEECRFGRYKLMLELGKEDGKKVKQDINRDGDLGTHRHTAPIGVWYRRFFLSSGGELLREACRDAVRGMFTVQ